MTKKQFIAYHKAQCTRMNKLLAKKNADYAGSNSDPFHNFKQIEAIGATTAEIGILTRLMDKISRTASLLNSKKKGKVKDESLEDTLCDAANYAIILACLLKSRKNKK